ncbi:MAG: hypothetical protein ABI217_03860 [Chthoniobacterales bacterium]
MRFIFSCTVMFGVVLAALADSNSPPATDELTGLPLYPATHNIADPGHPLKLPEVTICKCKMQTDFYNVYEAKMDATLAWCTANLAEFKHVHAYANGCSQDAFYNAEGTILVSVMGSHGKDGENTAAESISYKKFTPGLAEKTILGMKDRKIVCP